MEEYLEETPKGSRVQVCGRPGWIGAQNTKKGSPMLATFPSSFIITHMPLCLCSGGCARTAGPAT